LIIVTGKADYSVPANGLGQNGCGAGYLDEYTLLAALVFEVVSTFLFMVAIIDATGSGASPAMAGLAIGQRWLFIVAPIIGAVAAGMVFKTGLLDAEN
jgi:aquaporin Z